MCNGLMRGHISAILFLISIAGFPALSSAGNQERQTSNSREAMQAYEITLRALGVLASATQKPLSDETYNLAEDAAYLGITFLQRSNSNDAMKFLANLNLVNLDGELAETHTCAVLSKGLEISPYLDKALEAAKAKTCVLEGADVKIVGGLCATEGDAIRRISSQIVAVKSRRACQ